MTIQLTNYQCLKNKRLKTTDFEDLTDYLLEIHFGDFILSTVHM